LLDALAREVAAIDVPPLIRRLLRFRTMPEINRTMALCASTEVAASFFDAESGCRLHGVVQRLTQPAQLCFPPLRPVGHPHLVVHLYSGGEVLLGLLAIAPAAVKCAETEVAVSDQRTHAAGLGERQRLAVVTFGGPQEPAPKRPPDWRLER